MPDVKLVHLTNISGDVYVMRPVQLPVDPGFGVPVMPRPPGRPDNTLPGTPPGVDNTLPPGVDNTLPTPPAGNYPDNSLPSVPTQPLPPGVDNTLPVPPGIWPPPPPPSGFILAYIPGHGWKYVKLGLAPDQGLPKPPGVPTQPLPPTAQPKPGA